MYTRYDKYERQHVNHHILLCCFCFAACMIDTFRRQKIITYRYHFHFTTIALEIDLQLIILSF